MPHFIVHRHSFDMNSKAFLAGSGNFRNIGGIIIWRSTIIEFVFNLRIPACGIDVAKYVASWHLKGAPMRHMVAHIIVDAVPKYFHASIHLSVSYHLNDRVSSPSIVCCNLYQSGSQTERSLTDSVILLDLICCYEDDTHHRWLDAENLYIPRSEQGVNRSFMA